jgi:hypothetical protein
MEDPVSIDPVSIDPVSIDPVSIDPTSLNCKWAGPSNDNETIIQYEVNNGKASLIRNKNYKLSNYKLSEPELRLRMVFITAATIFLITLILSTGVTKFYPTSQFAKYANLFLDFSSKFSHKSAAIPVFLYIFIVLIVIDSKRSAAKVVRIAFSILLVALGIIYKYMPHVNNIFVNLTLIIIAMVIFPLITFFNKKIKKIRKKTKMKRINIPQVM